MKALQHFVATAVVVFSMFAAPGTAFTVSPFKKVSSGVLHVSSGVIFPPRVGAFRFAGTDICGAAGRDIGAQYNLPSVIRGDVFVYPMGTFGKDFNAELRVQQNAINQLNRSVKLVSQVRFQVNQASRGINGIRVQYELTRRLFGNKSRRCGSQLYLFRDGRWLFQYRFSYPIEQTGAANKEIAHFLRLWQWRARGTVTRLEHTFSDGRHS